MGFVQPKKISQFTRPGTRGGRGGAPGGGSGPGRGRGNSRPRDSMEPGLEQVGWFFHPFGREASFREVLNIELGAEFASREFWNTAKGGNSLSRNRDTGPRILLKEGTDQRMAAADTLSVHRSVMLLIRWRLCWATDQVRPGGPGADCLG